jgi:sulfur-oxidizing protein SoxY
MRLPPLMEIDEILKSNNLLTRRACLRMVAAWVGFAASTKALVFATTGWAQEVFSGLPQPDEKVEATLKRLFGNRPLRSGEGKIKLEVPLIAEDGGNVAITVDVNLPLTGATHVNNVYIISDKNRRPMLAKFSFTPESGKALAATSIRLATTTDVRAIVELSDSTLYAVTKHVRVTISGCDLPPQS